MVTSTVEQLTPTRVKLHITVTPDELKPSIDHAYKHIAEQVNIPGFRKGKVPAPIIDLSDTGSQDDLKCPVTGLTVRDLAPKS